METQREAEFPGTEDPIQSITDAGAQSGVDIVMDRESPVVMDCECGVLVRVLARPQISLADWLAARGLRLLEMRWWMRPMVSSVVGSIWLDRAGIPQRLTYT